MSTLIFRTIAPILVAVMLVFAMFVLLRGHVEPGGGFIGGLIAACALAIYGMASGVSAVRAALKVPPITLAGFGVLLAVAAGLLSLGADSPFLTGLWATVPVGGTEVAVSTPLLFDIGVFLTVFGTLTAIVLALEDEGEGS